MPPRLKGNRWALKKGLFKKEGDSGMSFNMALFQVQLDMHRF